MQSFYEARMSSVCTALDDMAGITPSSRRRQVSFRCHTCLRVFTTTAYNATRVRSTKWCSFCRMSRGHLETYDVCCKHLGEARVHREYVFDQCNKVQFDVVVILLNHTLVIEYDGKQHSTFIPKFHRTNTAFERQQRNDRAKEQFVLGTQHNHYMLRIAHTVPMMRIDTVVTRHILRFVSLTSFGEDFKSQLHHET